MASNWDIQYRSEEDMEAQILERHKQLTTRHFASVRYHPYEGHNGDQNMRLTSNPSSPWSSGSLCGVGRGNSGGLGGVIRADNHSEGAMSQRLASEPQSNAMMGRPIRGSHDKDSKAIGTPALSEPVSPLLRGDDNQGHIMRSNNNVYSPAPPAPAYTMEMVAVGPGIQVPKKKFLPRYLPMPVGTPPMGRGRPILGRGSMLYPIATETNLTSTSTNQELNSKSKEAAFLKNDGESTALAEATSPSPFQFSFFKHN